MESKKDKEKMYIQKWFDWNIKDDDLADQINNYHVGKYWSYRKITALLLVLLLVVNVLLYIFFASVSVDAIFIMSLIYLPLAYFAYKGKKWAILSIIIVWTLDKGGQIGSLIINSDANSDGSGAFWIIIIWYALFMKVFWRAYQVEERRMSLHKSSEQQVIKELDTKINKSKQYFQLIKSHKYFMPSVAFILLLAVIFFGYLKYQDRKEKESVYYYEQCLTECDNLIESRTQKDLCFRHCVENNLKDINIDSFNKDKDILNGTVNDNIKDKQGNDLRLPDKLDDSNVYIPPKNNELDSCLENTVLWYNRMLDTYCEDYIVKEDCVLPEDTVYKWLEIQRQYRNDCFEYYK